MPEKSQEYLENKYNSSQTKKRISGIVRLKMLYKHPKAVLFANRSKKAIDNVMHGLGNEVDETREMAKSFFKLLESKLGLSQRKEPPSKEEVKAAIEQLKDVGRLSVFTSISIIPGGGFSLIGLELLARKFGIKNFTFVPSSFRKKEEKEGDKDKSLN